MSIVYLNVSSVVRASFLSACRFQQAESRQGYIPSPKDLHGVNVTRELVDLAERLADNAHQIWAKQKMEELEGIGGYLVVKNVISLHMLSRVTFCLL